MWSIYNAQPRIQAFFGWICLRVRQCLMKGQWYAAKKGITDEGSCSCWGPSHVELVFLDLGNLEFLLGKLELLRRFFFEISSLNSEVGQAPCFDKTGCFSKVQGYKRPLDDSKTADAQSSLLFKPTCCGVYCTPEDVCINTTTTTTPSYPQNTLIDFYTVAYI